MPFQVDKSLNIFARYFHAMGLQDSRNIFTTNAGVVMMNRGDGSGQDDVTAGAITPLTNNGFLRADGNDLLIPLEGQLMVPTATGQGKWPIVLICHGQHRTEDNDHHRLLSYQGYTALQEYLATKGIASYSIDLYLTNLFRNNEDSIFKIGALDNNQRILLFFLHLKMLKIMAGETVNEPAMPDESSIRVFNGTGFDSLKDALSGAAENTPFKNFSNQVFGKIDFTKIGFMGHSRGADTVSRIPPYFFKGATLDDPTFPFHAEINNRIKKLSGQIGQPQQDNIKCILALEPTATVNEADPTKHGYVISNSQTIYFLGAGTNDEDVSFDVIRMYEYPTCSKAMIAVNGASHKRYNTVWATDIAMKDGKIIDEFDGSPVPPHLLQLGTHTEILKNLYGACFTGTLTANNSDLQYITREKPFTVAALADVEFQSAWKFGHPVGITAATLNNLDDTVTGLSKNKLDNGTDSLVQDLQALTVKKDNAGVSAIKIPVTPGSDNDLSKFTHFSFRFAKFFNPSSLGNRVEEKNFTIQLFANNAPMGKPVTGKNITTVELKPFNAFHLSDDHKTRELRYYILLQTVEVSLPGSFQGIAAADVARVTSVEIDIIPDPSKDEPHSGALVYGSTIGGGIVGGLLGAGGARLFKDHVVHDNDPDDNKYFEITGGILGAAGGSIPLYLILRAGTNIFAFNDFLLTNRQ